jgi:hypothetical protein
VSTVGSVGTDDLEAYLRAVGSLERVVVPPAVVEAQAKGGGRRIITSVEIWTNGIVLRTADLAVDLAREDWLAQVRLTDSNGTEYRFAGSGAGGSELVRFGYAMFRPKPPEDASHITVQLPMTNTVVMIPLVPLPGSDPQT